MDKWTNEQTDKWTNHRTNESPLCSTGLCPLQGRCPASHSDLQPCKAGQRVSLTTYCPWATCFFLSYFEFPPHLLLPSFLRRQVFAENERKGRSEGSFQRMTDAQPARQPTRVPAHTLLRHCSILFFRCCFCWEMSLLSLFRLLIRRRR